MSVVGLTRDVVLAHLCNEHGEPLEVRPWWTEAWVALDDPEKLELILKVVRQTGKSTFIAADAVTTLLTTPNAYLVLVAASESQQQAIYNRKIRRPLERLVRELGLEGEVRFKANGIDVPGLNSALEVVCSVGDTTPGRTVFRLYFDEARYVTDEVYAALAPSVIGGGGKIIIASTAGPPSGFFFELFTHPTERTWVYASAENDNPRASKGVLSFIKRRLALLMPAAAQRELGNEFVSDGDELIPAALIEAAVDDMLPFDGTSTRPAFAGGDLSARKDLTTIVVGTLERGLGGQGGHFTVRSIATWDPKASATRDVDFESVRQYLAMLAKVFPCLRKFLLDQAAESSSVLPYCRQHPRLALITEPFTATAETNMQIWSALAARINARTISIPRHERLIAELRGLRKEDFAFGSKWRVIDSSRKFHRDVSFSLALAVFAAGEQPVCTSPLCVDPDCTGRNPHPVLFSPEAAAWDFQHPQGEALRELEEIAREYMGPGGDEALAKLDAEIAALETDIARKGHS